MRILFYPRVLRSGDSQRSAVELAGAMVAAGHEVIMVAAPGILAERVHQLDIELVLLPDSQGNSTLSPVRHLVKVIRDRSIEVVHAFEWEAIGEAFLAANLSRRKVAVTGTIHYRGIPPILPHAVALLMGSRRAAGQMRVEGFTRVGVLEPWVDTDPDLVESVDTDYFLQCWHLDRNGLLVVLVTSRDSEPSVTNLTTAIEAAGDLFSEGAPVQLLVIGDSSLLGPVIDRAADINARCGREVVVIAGDLLDRRPAYAAADVVVASGGSVPQGMAFGKPVVIAGERGFFRPLSHATIDELTWNGWYGVGSGTRLGKTDLLTALEPLLESPRLREYRGTHARDLVAHYGLDEAVQRQLQEYRDAFDTRVGRFTRLVDMCRVGASLLVRRRLCGHRLAHRRPPVARNSRAQVPLTPPTSPAKVRCGPL